MDYMRILGISPTFHETGPNEMPYILWHYTVRPPSINCLWLKLDRKLEYWKSQEGLYRALCNFEWAMFKFYKSMSKLTVKVTF